MLLLLGLLDWKNNEFEDVTVGSGEIVMGIFYFDIFQAKQLIGKMIDNWEWKYCQP